MYSVQLESLVIQDSWKQAGSHLVREPWKLLQTASTVKFRLISQWARCTKLLQCELALPDCTHRPDSAQTGLVLLRSSAAAHPWKRCHPHTLVPALHWKHFAVTRFGVSMQPGVQHSHFSHLKLWPFIASGRTFSCWVKRWVKVDPCSLYYLMFPY